MKTRLLIPFLSVILFFPQPLSANREEKITILETASVSVQECERIMEQAEKLIKQGQISSGVQAYKDAIRQAPFYDKPYEKLSRLYFAANQKDDVLKVLELSGRHYLDFDRLYTEVDLNKNWQDSIDEKNQKRVAIAPFFNNKKGAFSFTFDDGSKLVYSKVLPIFDHYGFRITLALNPGLVPNENNDIWGDWNDWREAFGKGHEIANHTLTHQKLYLLQEEVKQKEIDEAYDLILDKIGVPPLTFVAPHDKVDPETRKLVLKRHVALREHEFLAKIYDKVFIPVYGGEYFSSETANKLVDLAKDKNFWIIAEAHSIETEEIKSYKPISDDFLKRHLEYLKANENEVWVNTFIDIYRYVLTRRKTNINIISERKGQITFSLTNDLESSIFKLPLTVVIDLSDAQVKQAVALKDGEKSPIPVRIVDGKALINVIPNDGAIYLKWI